MEEALAHLNALIKRGVEFPDAVWRCTQKFDVTSEELQDEYDRQF